MGRRLNANGKIVSASSHSCPLFFICLIKSLLTPIPSLPLPWHSVGNMSWRVKKTTRSSWKLSVRWFSYRHTSLKLLQPVMINSNPTVTGLLTAKTDHKVITEVVQDGNDFTWTQSIPNWTWTNRFKVGQECELATMKGTKFTVSHSQHKIPREQTS